MLKDEDDDDLRQSKESQRTLRPFARLIARNGRKTRSTRRILTTEIARSLMNMEINETATTTISRILKRFRQNAPG